ncbi:unnamed protein product [Strongylus vulgaris]|uniref:BTB domain-containing protein n=1 Tax=Strongylus vulgaris TaxID=40348 RepID=A0A3P7JF14_STRVU|nr:unnamed protein product [Strongylus vulgaris]
MCEFASTSTLRQFEVVLGGGSLFVNAHWMAEISPYFNRICFDRNFTEAREGCVHIKDVDYADVVAMLEYICPDANYLRQKRIGDTNLAALIHCSHRFQIPSLQRELYQYLENELPSEDCKLKPETLADAIAEALNAHFSPKFIAHMYKKFGEHGLDKMQEALKNMPNPLAETILSEARKYTPVITQEPISSSYHWNDFSRRMFF